MASRNGGVPSASPVFPITEPPVVAAPRSWRIYRIRRLADGRGYVGVTSRPLSVRLAMHDHMARLRPHLGGKGTLAEAICQAYDQDVSFQMAFQAELLAIASSPCEARHLECAWIATLGTARPNGFNILPGGASLGGRANSVPVTINHPTRGKLHYRSVMDAVADLDHERREGGQPPLQLGSVYSRQAAGWPLEEALGLEEHADGRRKRVPFRLHGRTYESLQVAAEGLAIDTIRSKVHRARLAGCEADHDVARDRRLRGARRTGRSGCGRQLPLALPHPLDPRAAPVDAARFARLSGVPKATVLHRYHRLLEGRDPDALTRPAMLAALMGPKDRRVPITLRLPDGRELSGGVREVIRDVLADPDLEASRAERLGFSAIRTRLRRIRGWPEQLPQRAVLWAFGFQPNGQPRASR